MAMGHMHTRTHAHVHTRAHIPASEAENILHRAGPAFVLLLALSKLGV